MTTLSRTQTYAKKKKEQRKKRRTLPHLLFVSFLTLPLLVLITGFILMFASTFNSSKPTTPHLLEVVEIQP